jgi:hypothetical protein
MILPRPKTPNVDKDNAHVHLNSPDGSDLSSDDLSVKRVTAPTKNDDTSRDVTSTDRGQQRGSNTGTQDLSVLTMVENPTASTTIGTSTSTPRQAGKSTRFLGSFLGQGSKSAGKMFDSAKNRLTPATRRPIVIQPAGLDVPSPVSVRGPDCARTDLSKPALD